MRCMTAIWPAGPPKLNSAIRSQTRNASRSETPCAGTDRGVSATASSAMGSLLHGGGRPGVGLRLQRAAPGIDRVVHDHPVREHLVVVREIGRETERDCEQAAALG